MPKFDAHYYEYELLKINSTFTKKNNIFTTIHKNMCHKSTEYNTTFDDEFIGIMDEIHNNYPLLYLPKFIDELMDGVYDTELVTKNALNSSDDLSYIKKNILGFYGSRHKGRYKKTINLKTANWKNNYDFLLSGCKKYQKLLMSIYYYDFFITFIILYLFYENKIITTEKLKNEIIPFIKKNNIVLPTRNDSFITKNFIIYVEQTNVNKYRDIFKQLLDLKYIGYDYDENIGLINNEQEISRFMFSIIVDNTNIKYSKLCEKIRQKYVILKIIPITKIIDRIINNLVKSNKIKIINGYKAVMPYDNTITLPAVCKKRG